MWALFILLLCIWPMGKVGGSPLFFPGFDKLVHCGLFFVLVVFTFNGFIQLKKLKHLPYAAAFLIAFVAIGYGALIELLQKYIFTWRGCELSDLFADTTGTFMGIFSALLTSRPLPMKKVRIIFAALLLTVVFSSCGLFKKDCHCPHFSRVSPVKIKYVG